MPKIEAPSVSRWDIEHWLNAHFPGFYGAICIMIDPIDQRRKIDDVRCCVRRLQKVCTSQRRVKPVTSRKGSKKEPSKKHGGRNTARKSQDEKSLDPQILFTSRTRNRVIQFERDPASFFGWTSCTYKSRQLNYRKPDAPPTRCRGERFFRPTRLSRFGAHYRRRKRRTWVA